MVIEEKITDFWHTFAIAEMNIQRLVSNDRTPLQRQRRNQEVIDQTTWQEQGENDATMSVIKEQQAQQIMKQKQQQEAAAAAPAVIAPQPSAATKQSALPVILEQDSSDSKSGSYSSYDDDSEEDVEEIPMVRQNAQRQDDFTPDAADDGDDDKTQAVAPAPPAPPQQTRSSTTAPSMAPSNNNATSAAPATLAAVQAVPNPPASLLPIAAGTWIMFIRLQWPFLARAYDLYALWVTMIRPENVNDLDQARSFAKAAAAQPTVLKDTDIFNQFMMMVRHYGILSRDERLRLIPAPVSGFYRGPFAQFLGSWTMSDVFELIIMNNTVQARTFVSVAEYGNLLFGYAMKGLDLSHPSAIDLFVYFARQSGVYPAWMQPVMDEVLRGPAKRGSGGRRRDRVEDEESVVPGIIRTGGPVDESEDADEEYEDDDEDSGYDVDDEDDDGEEDDE